MALPGSTVFLGERAAASGAASGTANGFIVGFTERGPVDEPVLIVSITDFEEHFGERLEGHPEVYDGVDVAFREAATRAGGASAIYIGRVVGDAVATATKDLIDASSKPTLAASANSPGEWGNDVDVVVAVSGSNFTLTVKYQGSTVETSPTLANNTEAVAWAEGFSNYIVLEDLSTEYEPTGDPKVQTAELTGGAGDIAGADTANLEAALALFSRDLGPGQVVAPLMTTEAVHKAIATHCVKNNRRGLLDLADTSNHETLIAAGTALRALPEAGARFVYPLAQRGIAPGLSLGTTRRVSRACAQMGRIARSEAEGFNPNRASAGKLGDYQYLLGLSETFNDTQREELTDAGVNVAILRRGIPVNFGNRTAVNPLTEGDWKSFSASRLVMAVAAFAGIVLEDYEFQQIDGRGYIFKKLEGDLASRACLPFYLADALFGQTPAEAFSVNTGPDVNTPTTIKAEEIKAQIALRVSATGEVLSVEIVKVPTTENLP